MRSGATAAEKLKVLFHQRQRGASSPIQGSHCHEKPGKIMKFVNVISMPSKCIFHALESCGKVVCKITETFGKVMKFDCPPLRTGRICPLFCFNVGSASPLGTAALSELRLRDKNKPSRPAAPMQFSHVKTCEPLPIKLAENKKGHGKVTVKF